jgi:hypothetical protein
MDDLLGGGDVATFKYHIFDPTKTLSIHGLDFTPLPGNDTDCIVIWSLTYRCFL